jgi:hypothetical protein
VNVARTIPKDVQEDLPRVDAGGNLATKVLVMPKVAPAKTVDLVVAKVAPAKTVDLIVDLVMPKVALA